MTEDSRTEVAYNAVAFAVVGAVTAVVPYAIGFWALKYGAGSSAPLDVAGIVSSATIAATTGAGVGALAAAQGPRVAGLAPWKRAILGAAIIGPVWGVVAAIAAVLVGLVAFHYTAFDVAVVVPTVVLTCTLQAAWFWPAWMAAKGPARALVPLAAIPSSVVGWYVWAWMFKILIFATMGNAGDSFPMPGSN